MCLFKYQSIKFIKGRVPMSKRKRLGGPVAVSRPTRPRIAPQQGTKRPYGGGECYTPKRFKQESHKRGRDFDCEVDNMHKRLRYSTPTAEETMAFMLPHLLSLRRMYQEVCEEKNRLSSKCKVLEEHNIALTKGYQCLAKASQEKQRQLERQVDMAQYRLTLCNNTF